MKLRFKLGQKGFTLVELMVVVAILSVLMAIVAPAVTGTKEMSVSGQVKSDADATQKAVDNYSNKAIRVGYPTADPSSSGPAYSTVNLGNLYADSDSGRNVILVDKDGNYVGQLASKVRSSGLADNADNYTTYYARQFVNFAATTSVYDATGAVKDASFVPDFLIKLPSSLPLAGYATKSLGNTNNVYPEYLWLAKINAPGTSQEGRNVEIYRLKENSSTVTTIVTVALSTVPAGATASATLKDSRGLTFTSATVGQSPAVGSVTIATTSVTYTGTTPIGGSPGSVTTKGLFVYEQIF